MPKDNKIHNEDMKNSKEQLEEEFELDFEEVPLPKNQVNNLDVVRKGLEAIVNLSGAKDCIMCLII